MLGLKAEAPDCPGPRGRVAPATAAVAAAATVPAMPVSFVAACATLRGVFAHKD